MNPFVGYKKKPLSIDDLLKLITELKTECSYYFFRWTYAVSGIKNLPPDNNDFPMMEGQMFNHQCELRWKYKNNNTYEVLLLSIQGKYEDFELLGTDWLTQNHDAHLYQTTETRFPKGFSSTDVDVKQRYFIDKKTATVHFVALTVEP